MARSAYLNGLGGSVIVNTTGGGDNVGTGGSGGGSGGGNTGRGNTPSNVKPFFRLSQLETSDVNGADAFNVNHDGGRIFFIQPHLSVDSTKYPDSDWIKPKEWISHFTVNDDKEIEIHRPYTIVQKVGTGQDFIIPEEMTNLSFSMSFEPIEDEETQVTSSIYQGSYADITIGNLRTYSGDVHRTKIYAKRQGHTANGFFKIADFVLQPDNQLIDSASLSGKLPIGLFYTQSIIDNNWQTSSATVSATLRDTYLVGGVSLSGSNENVNDSYTFETKNNMVFTKGEDYQVLFDLQYFKADKSGSYTAENDTIITAEPHAEIEVYLSGSIESGNADVEYSLGTFSSNINSPDYSDVLSNTSGSIRRVYNIFRTHNITNQISSGSLGFRIKSGRFDLSAISITPFVDQNFNPGFTNVSVPMPVNDEAQVRYDFLAEFYDFNNNKSVQLAETSASVLFEGPRKVISITGDDIWDGTATIGRSMKLHGSNPAFLSTIGYNGFEKTRDHTSDRERDGGVLLFSGSIGLGATENFLTASEAYDGVGLEILDASSNNSYEHRFLKFRTNPSEFTVQTNQFLLGVSGSGGAESFISSSGNILEISSSNFHLSSSGNLNVGNSAMVVTPAGDLTLQGSITATAGGQIGGFTITDKAISTTDFFLSGSTYSGTGFQNTNLVLSSSGFQINSDGEISASEGAIGGFGIGASSLSATGFFISGSSTGTGFADTNLFISSSGFQVNAVGAISASSGVIGGFGISKDSISDTAGTPKFFISGSPGATNNMADTNLFISASGFQVNSTGEISASAGVIGGFSIGADKLSGGTDADYVGLEPGVGIQLGDSTFADADFSVTNAGVLKAQSGTIGGFTLSANELTATNFELNPSGKRITLGTGTSIFIADGDEGIQLGNGTFANAPFSVTTAGELKAELGTIGGFTITSTELYSLDSGTPDSSPNNGITIDTTGGSNSKAVIRVFDGTTENAALGNYASGKFGIKAIEGEIGGFQISGDSISSTDIFISGSPVAGGVDDSRYKFISTTNFNVKQDGDITGSAVLFTGGKVGGFTIDEDSIEGGNLVLHSAGRVESADFSSGVMAGTGQGFRLSAEGNGFLEVENARIRGTLSTAVFEKETVNAVGGIMMIGNSTVITGSGGFSGVTASSATMSVENVSGFTGSYNGFNTSTNVITDASLIDGEILMIKKFDNTGFSTEYVLVQGVEFNGDATAQNNGTDLSGKLFVTRSFNGTTGGNKDGVGSNQSKTGTAGFTGSYIPGGNAQNYEDGQVVVSTGKYFSGTAAGGDISGSGFIMLNAKSTDQFTPYIDIIERTGSQVYSMELKARLGDLSGLSSALVGSDPGFGLFSENVFLTGKITATSGEIAGWGLVGNKITSSNGSVELDSTGPGRISLGGTPPTDTTGDGAFLSGSGEFYVGKNNGERLHFNPTGNGLVVSSSNLSVEAGNLTISSSLERIQLGTTSTFGSGTGVLLGKDGSNYEFYAGNGSKYIWWDGANLNIQGGTINIGSVSGMGAFTSSMNTTTGSINSHTGSVNSTTGSINSFTGSYETQVVLSSAGMKLLDLNTPTANTLADFGTDIHLNVGQIYVGNTGSSATTGDWVEIDSTSIDINRNGQTSMSLAAGGITIGDTSTDYIDIKAASIDMYRNGNPEISLTDGKVVVAANTTAPTVDSVVVEGGQGVKIYDSATAYAHISATGLDVVSSSANIASFGGDTRIGQAADTRLIVKTVASPTGLAFYTGSADADITFFVGKASEVEAFTQTGGACLLFGSQVSKSDGTIVNVEDLEVGDELLSVTLPNATDENVGDWKQDTFNVSSSFNQQTTTIENVSHLTSDHYYNINNSSELITGTHYMLYRISNSDEWVWEVAPNFEIGNFLMDKNGDEVEITSINRIEGDFNVVSIDTETDDFYVASTFMVHNKGGIPNGYTLDGAVVNNLIADAIHSTGSADITGSLYVGGTSTLNDAVTAPTVKITSGDDFVLGELTNNLRMKGNSTDGFNFLNSSNGWADLNFRRGIAATDMSISGSAKVTGSLYAQGLKISGSTGVGNQVMIHVDDNTNTYFQVLADGEVIARDNISAFAGASAFTSISDERLKKDVHTMSGSMNKILQLRPTEFTWKDNNKEDAGFIAQEVEKILPDVVYETKGFVDIESGKQGDTKYKTIAYSKLTTYLVDTIQQLNKRIEELEKKVK